MREKGRNMINVNIVHAGLKWYKNVWNYRNILMKMSLNFCSLMGTLQETNTGLDQVYQQFHCHVYCQVNIDEDHSDVALSVKVLS